jgi:hypothetical protein
VRESSGRVVFQLGEHGIDGKRKTAACVSAAQRLKVRHDAAIDGARDRGPDELDLLRIERQTVREPIHAWIGCERALDFRERLARGFDEVRLLLRNRAREHCLVQRAIQPSLDWRPLWTGDDAHERVPLYGLVWSVIPTNIGATGITTVRTGDGERLEAHVAGLSADPGRAETGGVTIYSRG